MDVSWLILLIIPNKIAGFDLFKDVFLWGYLLLKTSELSLGFSSLYFTFSVILFSSVLYFLSFSCDFILSFLYVLWNISYAWFSKCWLPKLTVVSFIFSTEVFSWLIMAFFFFFSFRKAFMLNLNFLKVLLSLSFKSYMACYFFVVVTSWLSSGYLEHSRWLQFCRC